MFRDLRNNESGVVLVMVLMVVIIMMVYSIGVVARGTSQRKSAEEQIDSIKKEQLALGVYAKSYTDLASGTSMQTSFSETLDNKTYNMYINIVGAGPDNTNSLAISDNP